MLLTGKLIFDYIIYITFFQEEEQIFYMNFGTFDLICKRLKFDTINLTETWSIFTNIFWKFLPKMTAKN